MRRKTVVKDVRRGVGRSTVGGRAQYDRGRRGRVRGMAGRRSVVRWSRAVRQAVGAGVGRLRVCAATGSVVLGCARRQYRSRDDGGVARRGRSVARYGGRSGRNRQEAVDGWSSAVGRF